MRNIVIIILTCFLSGCSKEKIDPYVISRESIQGEWFLARQVEYKHDPETKEITDSFVTFNLYELHIGESDLCIKREAGLPFDFEYEMGFIEPDTLWIMPCPVDFICEVINNPEKYTIIEFNSNEIMVMLQWGNYFGLIGRKEYVKI